MKLRIITYLNDRTLKTLGFLPLVRDTEAKMQQKDDAFELSTAFSLICFILSMG